MKVNFICHQHAIRKSSISAHSCEQQVLHFCGNMRSERLSFLRQHAFDRIYPGTIQLTQSCSNFATQVSSLKSTSGAIHFINLKNQSAGKVLLRVDHFTVCSFVRLYLRCRRSNPLSITIHQNHLRKSPLLTAWKLSSGQVQFWGFLFLSEFCPLILEALTAGNFTCRNSWKSSRGSIGHNARATRSCKGIQREKPWCTRQTWAKAMFGNKFNK